MNKNQLSFVFAGLLFGFLVGFVVAHEMYAGRGMGFQHPPIPPGMALEGAAASGGGGDRPGAAAGMRGGAGGGAPSGMPPGGSSGNPGAGPGAGAGGEGSTATMEQVQREIKALKDLLEKDPKNLAALTRMGDMYFDAGMFDKAKTYYAQALALKPDDVNLQTDLGTSLRNTGEPQEAMKQFEAAVTADPKHWKGWFNIGIVALYDMGDFDRAREAFEKVAALNPGSVDMEALKKEIERLRAEKAGGGGRS